MAKVLSIIPYKVLPAQMGGQKGIHLFYQFLQKHVPVTALCTSNNDFATPTLYETRPFLTDKKSRYADFSLVGKICDLIRKEGFTHFITEHPYYAWLGYAVQKRTGVKWIVHSHNIEYQRFKDLGKPWWPILKRYEQWAYRKADATLFISNDDKQWALQHMHTPAQKALEATYGVELPGFPTDKLQQQQLIRQKHSIPEGDAIILFNGSLRYEPNIFALERILHDINPELMRSGLSYKIVVCGSGLPESYGALQAWKDQNIIYAGFVDDIDPYFKAADIFLSPIVGGGGIKTKVVEAIGLGNTVITTANAAIGLNIAACGNKLQILDNNDWQGFTQAAIQSIKKGDYLAVTPSSFYDYYYWDNIIQRIMPAFA